MATAVHFNRPHTVYAGRGPGGCHMLNTKPSRKGWLGNPFPVSLGLDNCIEKFRIAFYEKLASDDEFWWAVNSIPQDAVLACWCKPRPCHADVIVEYLNNRKERKLPAEEKNFAQVER